MKCPHCGKEMQAGVVQSARRMFWTDKENKNWVIPDLAVEGEILISSHNWIIPTCIAFNCNDCKKIIIDYSKDNKQNCNIR